MPVRAALWVGARRARVALERLLLPPATGVRPLLGDFSRPVILVASLALGFFLPSLPLAGVPVESWALYIVVAGVGGVVLASSFFVERRGVMFLIALAVVDSLVVAFLGALFREHYHQIDLLYAIVVAALGVVHGLRPALTAAAMGAFLVPFVVGSWPDQNVSDPVYAGIYLFGAALLPWTGARLAERRAAALRRQLDRTRAGEQEAVLILGRAAEAKDGTTGEHVGRVGDLSWRLALATGMDRTIGEDLRFAAMLHDVGKLHVPDSILQKPGPLTEDEIEVIRAHTIWGPRILGSSSAFDLARLVARSHHENWDGSGYPDRLRREDIPFAARIVRITDVFDALRSKRPYKPAWSLERCLEEIRAGAGRAFDPELARLFVDLIDAAAHDERPPGAADALLGVRDD